VTVDGRRAVSASYDKTLKVWDLASGREPLTLQGHADKVIACAIAASGERIISISYDHTLKVWDLASGHELSTLRGHADRVSACAIAADGRRVVSASVSGTIEVWNLLSERELFTLPGHIRLVAACAVTVDGRYAVTASNDHTLKIWDLEIRRVRAVLVGHAQCVIACAVTFDGRFVVSASDDRKLKIWSLTSGQELSTLYGHSSRVTACAVTPDGRRVVSASDDHTIKVWDLATGACLFTHRANAVFTAVAATMTAIIAGDATGAVWFLDLPAAELHGHAALESLDSGSPSRSQSTEEPSPRRSPMQKHTILFLAANPSETPPLALDREVRAIQKELEQSGFRDCFELVTRWAVEPLDLLRELRKVKPTVVHFSGHGGYIPGGGTAGGRAADTQPRPDPVQSPHRDLVPAGSAGSAGSTGVADAHSSERQHGLYFQGADGRAQFVSAQAIEATFGAAGSSVRLVVLSACYSDAQAEALLAHVDCVVGMSDAIRDEAARSFAIGFYGGLGERESIAAAHAQGRAAISLEGLSDSALPQLRVRPGVDARRLVLAADLR
jgi:hypothetical protein